MSAKLSDAARSPTGTISWIITLPLADPALLSAVTPTPGRLDPREVAGVTWLLDMYNASPESISYNLRFLADLATTGRKVFVFGGMRELGEQSAARHIEVGRATGHCDAVFLIGSEAQPAAAAAQAVGVNLVSWSATARGVVSELRHFSLVELL